LADERFRAGRRAGTERGERNQRGSAQAPRMLVQVLLSRSMARRSHGARLWAIVLRIVLKQRRGRHTTSQGRRCSPTNNSCPALARSGPAAAHRAGARAHAGPVVLLARPRLVVPAPSAGVCKARTGDFRRTYSRLFSNVLHSSFALCHIERRDQASRSISWLWARSSSNKSSICAPKSRSTMAAFTSWL